MKIYRFFYIDKPRMNGFQQTTLIKHIMKFVAINQPYCALT